MVQVEDIVIRVQGMGAEEARLMGEEVANRIAAQLPESVDSKRIDELNIKLFSSQGTDRGAMADNIAAQILQQLKML